MESRNKTIGGIALLVVGVATEVCGGTIASSGNYAGAFICVIGALFLGFGIRLIMKNSKGGDSTNGEEK